MRNRRLAIALVLTATSAAGAQEQQAPLRVAASSYASVEVHINSRRIGNRWYEEEEATDRAPATAD